MERDVWADEFVGGVLAFERQWLMRFEPVLDQRKMLWIDHRVDCFHSSMKVYISQGRGVYRRRTSWSTSYTSQMMFVGVAIKS